MLDIIRKVFLRQLVERQPVERQPVEQPPVEQPPVDVTHLYYEDYDDDSDDEFIGEDEWEDQKGMELLKAQLKIPEEWYLVKVSNFDHQKLIDIMTWCEENCSGQWKKVGWSIGCGTKTGIALENSDDAIFFKLRWR